MGVEERDRRKRGRREGERDCLRTGGRSDKKLT